MSPTGAPGVVVTVTVERIRKLEADCQAILDEGKQVTKARVRQLAGFATWIAGVMPQMTAFTTMLWAAVNHGRSELLRRSKYRER